MLLADVPQVGVDYTLGYKFIVVEVADSSGNKKTIVRVKNQNYEYHKDILVSLKGELEVRGFTCRCLGGGMIKINLREKTFWIGGSSGDYGTEPNRNETLLLLQAEFPDFQGKSRG
jgi:hypothetical protein